MSRKQRPAQWQAELAARQNAKDHRQAVFAVESIASRLAESSASFELTSDSFADWHPALRPMRITVERMLDANHPDAWHLLGALATVNGCKSFRDEFDAEAVRP